MNEIRWPEMFTPGMTDHFVSVEKILAGMNAAQIWPLIGRPTVWPQFHPRIAEVSFGQGEGVDLAPGSRFVFRIGDVVVNAELAVLDAPTPHRPAQIAWIGRVNAGTENAVTAYFAWLIEDLEGGRVRVLAQESLLGKPALAMAGMRPDPVLNAHHDWLMNLVAAVGRQRAV